VSLSGSTRELNEGSGPEQAKSPGTASASPSLPYLRMSARTPESGAPPRADANDMSTGVRKEWLGMTRRVHRSACILMTLFM
jgi:hypothetical protein